MTEFIEYREGIEIAGLTQQGRVGGDEAAREALIAAVERAMAEVQGRIDMLRFLQPDGEAGPEAEELEAQLRALSEQRQQVERAPAGQLGRMKMDVSAGISATRIAAEGAAARGHQQIAMHVVEMHAEEISAVMARNDKAAAGFRQYEQRSSRRIDQLAADKGIDVSGVRESRYRLLAERMAAEAGGDRAGVFKSEALLAYNNVLGLELVGATPEEQEKGKREAQEARERYLKERELQALNEGRKSGMTGDALRSHVDAARSRAAVEMDEVEQKLRKKAGLPDKHVEEIMKIGGDRATDLSQVRSETKEGDTASAGMVAKGGNDADKVAADLKVVAGANDIADDLPASTERSGVGALPSEADKIKSAAREAATGLKGVTTVQTNADPTTSQNLPKEQKVAAPARA